MRPHRLRVQAFGAFAGTEQVAFDDLEGLFLLHGETGAGKTTLLDAIAFALYGRVPGERGSAKRLRSDHAAAGLTTEVELEATIGGRRLRISRKPEQDRPKKSGTGVTREQAAVRLDERTAAGGWESKSVRLVEADQEIRDLMGMSAEQFFQVVLLPQGQFARFLHASAQDKEALLQKLFSTDRFRAVERWLADRRLAVEKEVAAAFRGISLLTAQVAQAADVPVPDSAPDPDQDAAQWVAGLAADALAAQDQAAVHVAARRVDLDGALAAKTEAEQLAGRQRRRGDALRRQRELQDAAPVIAALRAEADAALRAAQVKADLEAADRAATAAAGARTAEARARALIADGSETPVAEMPADATAETLHAAAEEQRTQLGRLDVLRAVARQAADEDKIATAARARAVAIDSDLTAVAAAVASREQARPQAVLGRDAASQAAAALPVARAAAERPPDGGRRRQPGARAGQPRPPARDAPGRPREGSRDAHDGPDRPRGAHRWHASRARRDDDRRQSLPGLRLPRPPRSRRADLRTGQPGHRRRRQRSRRPGDGQGKQAGQDVAAADGRIAELAQRLRQASFAPLAITPAAWTGSGANSSAANAAVHPVNAAAEAADPVEPAADVARSPAFCRFEYRVLLRPCCHRRSGGSVWVPGTSRSGSRPVPLALEGVPAATCSTASRALTSAQATNGNRATFHRTRRIRCTDMRAARRSIRRETRTWPRTEATGAGSTFSFRSPSRRVPPSGSQRSN